jgi:putative ABC transport system permease protein
MRPSDCLKIGWQALRVHTGRSLLTTLGIVVGVAAVICTMAIGAGAEDEVAETLRTLGANLLAVTPGAQVSRGVRMEAGGGRSLTERDAAAIRAEIPEVQIAASLISKRLQVIASGRNSSTLVAGITPDYLDARGWSASEGRLFDLDDLDSGAKVAIVGSDVSHALFEDRSAVGETIRIGKVPATVIAVLAPKGAGVVGRSQDDVVFVPLSMARSRLVGAADSATRDSLELIAVKVADVDKLAEAKPKIEALLRQRHRLWQTASDDFLVEDPADILHARANATRALAWLFLASASVSLAVGGISIMNIMLVAVGERTRELGVRVAVGATPRDLVLQLLVETVLLALAGGLIGSVFGIAGSFWLAWQAGWRTVVSPASVLVAWGLAGLVGVVFGLYPALRAARLDPIEALRSE